MNAQVPLLPSTTVHDRRNLPLWVTLAFSAGAVNAAALAACQRFVSHVTGTVTRVGADYGSAYLLLDYAAVLAAFVVGAMSSFWMLDGRRLQGKAPLVGLPLALVATVLAVVAVLGRLDAFGPFGKTVETPGDFVMLGLLAFAMGLQNASVASTSGMIVRTTHMTGPLTDLSIALGAYLSSGVPAELRTRARAGIVLRGAKILAFITGALVATVAASRLEYLTFFIPAGFVAVAAHILSGVVDYEGQAVAAT
ncbi:MAG TPA: YoaK family protein [Polyangiaceae bacterium]|nr:YoaK family protein [Polyangiaceae bacterium]